MSQATKRRFVSRQIRDEEPFVPEGDHQRIVRVLGGRGSNLHAVQDGLTGEEYLASMPRKFRRGIFIKRNHYALVEQIPEGQKVRAEILLPILPKQKDYLIEQGQWPERFARLEEKRRLRDEASEQAARAALAAGKPEDDDDEEDSCSDNDDDLFQNNNRLEYYYSEEETDSDEEGEDDEESSEEEGDDAEEDGQSAKASNDKEDMQKLKDSLAATSVKE